MKFQKENEKFLILLPKWSALILTGEIRYAWKHSIASRKIDWVGKDLLFRKLRYSLTFWKSKKPFCDCKFEKYCEFQ